MHKFFFTAALAAATLVLGACGGSAFTGSAATPASAVASLVITTDTSSIPADGSSGANITVIAKDANNAALSGATVTFSGTAGNVTTIQGATDSSGTAKATVVAGSAAAGTMITVTAASGAITATTVLTVANTQKTLTLLTSLPSIPSDGSKTATITAYVRDASNNFVQGQGVGFQASSGGLTVTQATTDASGAALATLSSAGDPANRIITVTAQAGTTSATLTVGVVGTKLTVSGPSSLVQGATGTYTVSLTDAGGNGIANQVVTMTSALGNTLAPATFTTDSTGQKTVTLTATAAGSDTVTASGAGLTASQDLSISNDSFKFTAPAVGAIVNLGVSTPVVVNYTSAGVPQQNKTVTFSATRGTLGAATAMTDASGNASVTISSAASGGAVISATTPTGTGVLTAQGSLTFRATNPASLKAQASPASIPTQGTSTITVTVRDAVNNLVAGQAINFAISQDVTGGTLSVASATTDATGQASTVYTASTTTSATNGVVIKATVASTPTVFDTTSLTVAGQTVFLSLGTGNLIFSYPKGDNTDVQYKLPYAVQAVDNAGHGVNNVTVVFTVKSLNYGKGKLLSGTPWTVGYSTAPTDADAYVLTGYPGCKSEDVNNDGIYTTANDYNTNGHLDPGLVANTDIPNAVTANGGSASFNIIYPKDHAYWVGVRLTATATVSGTQSSTFTDFWLPGAATDYSNPTVTPPGLFSPYGLATTCLDPK